jgi:hypothetical protein
MAPTPPNDAVWPSDELGKVLLHVEIGASVDDVFADVFGVKSPLQVI